MNHRYAVGTTFKRYSGKTKRVETIVDVHTTTNLAGEVVGQVYVTEHEFAGQTVKDYHVHEATIARSEIFLDPNNPS